MMTLRLWAAAIFLATAIVVAASMLALAAFMIVAVSSSPRANLPMRVVCCVGIGAQAVAVAGFMARFAVTFLRLRKRAYARDTRIEDARLERINRVIHRGMLTFFACMLVLLVVSRF